MLLLPWLLLLMATCQARVETQSNAARNNVVYTNI